MTTPGRLYAREKIAAIVITAILMSFAYPKPGLWFLAWIGMTPMLMLTFQSSQKESFYLGWACGFLHHIITMYWVPPATSINGNIPLPAAWAALIVLFIYLAIFWGIFFALVSRTRGTGLFICLACPLFWVVLEFIKDHVLTGIPWLNMAYTQPPASPQSQIADILGISGISFVLIMANTSAAQGIHAVIKKKNWKSIIAPFLIFIPVLTCVLWYGHSRLQAFNNIRGKDTMKAAVIQANIPQDVKWSKEFVIDTIDHYTMLTKKAAPYAPELIIWPETATPFYFGHNEEETAYMIKNLEFMDAFLFFGTPSYAYINNKLVFFNRGYLLDKSKKIAGIYDKVKLVPFAEYVPLKNILFFVDKLVASVGDFMPGKEHFIMNLDSVKFGALICYEAVFPYIARKYCNNGANFLINITNDGWFGTTWGPYQHSHISRFRAIENRIFMIRAANTGISGFISPDGRYKKMLNLEKEGILAYNIPLKRINTRQGDARTFYTKYGDLWVYSMIILFIILVVAIKPGRNFQ